MSKKAIIEKLREGTENVKPINLGDVSVGLKVLRHNHYHDAQMIVSGYYQEQGIKVGMHNLDDFEMDKEDQYLLKTVVDLDTKEPLFENIEELRELLHKDKRKQLLDEAEIWQEECSPNLSNYSEEEFQELVEEVKKTPKSAILNGLNLHTLKKLVHTLADLQRT